MSYPPLDPLLVHVPMPIHTPRLTLVPWHPDYTADFHQAREESLPDLSPWMIWADKSPTIDETHRTLRKGYADFTLRNTLNMLALDDAGDIVISTGLHGFDWNLRNAAIGYWCRSRYVGQGYVTEAANALVQFGFNALGLRKISIEMDSENTRSEAIAKRLNMIKEAERVGISRTLHTGDALRTRLDYCCFDTKSLPPLEVRW